MTTSGLALLLAVAVTGAQPESSPAVIRVDDVLVTLIEEVQVPAREAGVLALLAVREGTLVRKFTLEKIAPQDGRPEEENTDETPKDDARAKYLARPTLLGRIDEVEAQLLTEKARIELDIAQKEADNDLKVQFAQKALEVSEKELQRAKESNKQFSKSVSETEVERLRLSAEELRLRQKQAEHDQVTARLTAQLKQNELQLAENALDRRRIVAPIDGMVVEITRRAGEWVEPGDTVMRIVRLDRLRVEGFVNAAELTQDVTARPITLLVDLPGRPAVEFQGSLVFVSPEINAVNGQVRVWAEVENPELTLKPGMSATLVINPPAGADKPAPPKSGASE